MRVIFGLVLLAGVALAGGAVYMAKDYIGQYQSELARAKEMQREIVPTQTVYVATRPLKYGEELKEGDVRPVRWPVEAIPDGTFTDIAAIFPEGVEEKRLIVRPMEPNEASKRACAPLRSALTSPVACQASCDRATRWMCIGRARSTRAMVVKTSPS